MLVDYDSDSDQEGKRTSENPPAAPAPQKDKEKDAAAQPEKKKVKLPSAASLLSKLPGGGVGGSSSGSSSSSSSVFASAPRGTAASPGTGTDLDAPMTDASMPAGAPFHNKRTASERDSGEKTPVDAATRGVSAFLPPQVRTGRQNISLEEGRSASSWNTAARGEKPKGSPEKDKKTS
uniref:Uncharacterized protein n=1 Tax=Chromera velia CCMP2878 TaxID=1169474 RepID=A0A0G4IB92_9ALVE|mmetsp:Transcript_50941/g.100129  ORF Transcript_50941/g.100129 Transcript_50941/m.100129 type:complete len:178 (+) Transcript_50941:226-759(+)|eukprot:Cvel_12795.t1-p1 / transcript=Cvel_12795.t1 / gene=Cvel_12795 / organism=Chromera_velia_CCMP2878 / gene_product=hypothetical protein / transcript_product=hypothetical protein / location=Cvel_scaffold852:2111-4580(+) / protein_length=177 / sequence_SO=supercontig / SO=protein_coding / is_pseudo=false